MIKKNLKALTLLLLISIFIFAITGCSSNSEDPLSSSKSYNINFTVADQNEEAVAAADLTLDGETKKTNADGVVSFRKADGKYDYEVSALGYKHFSNSILVNGADTLEELKLQFLSSGGDEPGDEDDNTSPLLTELYAWVNGDFYGLNNQTIGQMIKEIMDKDEDLNQSFDYFIVYFSEIVKVKAGEEIEAADFTVQFESANSVEQIKIGKAVLNSEFLMLKIDDIITSEMLKDETAEFSVKVNESGRQKIFDLAENMLAEEPDTLILLID